MKTPSTPRITQESIRAELLAQPQYIQQLPKIQALLLRLEGKGGSKIMARAKPKKSLIMDDLLYLGKG